MYRGDIIYLAVLEDRHIDPVIVPFFKRWRALEQVKAWQSEYPQSEWEELDIDCWEYYVRDTCDDGPQMRIERATIG